MNDTLTRGRWFVVALLGLARILLLIYGLSTLQASDGTQGLGMSVWRYDQLANTPGEPYRDFPVENPPVAQLFINAIDPGTPLGLASRLAVAMLLCELVLEAALWWAWGSATAFRAWVLATPLAFFAYFRYDYLAVALAVASFALIRKRRDGIGGAALSVAGMAKLWPLAGIPLVWAKRRGKAVVVSILATVAIVAGWLAFSGLDGPVEVLTFRHAKGWEIGSSAGLFLWRVSGLPTRFEAGAIRVGHIAPWESIALAAVLALTVAWVTLRVRARPEFGDGLGMVIVVGTLLICAPLFSDSYILWLIPWVAIAGVERVTLWCAIGIIATAGAVTISISALGGNQAAIGLMLALRNLAVAIVALTAFVSLRRTGGKQLTPEAEDRPVAR